MTIRIAIISVWLIALLSGISYIFWQNEYKYSLPTPTPANYQFVKKGEIINWSFDLLREKNKPTFIHFFNPSCPCSIFNMKHFQSLVKEYGERINFVVVVMNDPQKYCASEIQEKFNLQIPILFDPSIAINCGVYSTPQAVLINIDHKLYYRGNYNKSRYCTTATSNYAQIAIDSLLDNKCYPAFNQDALKAYGCQLPNCKK